MTDRTAQRPAIVSGRAWALVLGLTVVSFGLAVWLKSWCGIPGATAGDLYVRWCYSDVPPLFLAERLHEGAIPYLDHPVEYPVLTGLWMWLAALPVTTMAAFFWATATLLLGSALATTVLLAREVGLPRTLVFAAAPTLAVSGAVNWDLPAVALATAGLIAHPRCRDVWSGALLGLGTAAKLYPGLFLLAVVPAAWRLRGRAAGLATALGAAVAWWAVNTPVALAAPEAWGQFFALSRGRPADWDSLYTLVANAGGPVLDTPTLNLISAVALLTGLVVLGAVAWRRVPPERWHLLALPALIVFLLANKVYSPQFSLWLLPLLVLAFPGWRWVAAFAVADVAVTATRFPYLAGFVGDGVDGAWGYLPFGSAIAVRAVVLVAIAVVTVRRAVTPPPDDVEESTTTAAATA